MDGGQCGTGETVGSVERDGCLCRLERLRKRFVGVLGPAEEKDVHVDTCNVDMGERVVGVELNGAPQALQGGQVSGGRHLVVVSASAQHMLIGGQVLRALALRALQAKVIDLLA